MVLRNWYGHMNATRKHSQLMLLLLTVTMLIGCLPIGTIMPTIAYASTMTAVTDAYQLYDTRERTEQISVNKVWDDGLTNDTRTLNESDADGSYENHLSMTIQTGVPQATLRTYTITYDANGGIYGTDANGSAMTTNTIAYNAKNQPVSGTYTMPERTDGYSLVGWNTNKTATSPDTSITLTNTPSDGWMNARADGSNTMLYAVWKDLRINYAVMAYGIGVDKDASGNTMGITFGPALGYPEFSPYNHSESADTSSTQTFTKFHTVSGDATVMDESAAACTDSFHSVITGTDAGTDAAGNAYRCLHYDNWATIIYWNEHDPHVYDKCIPNHCSKTVTITPNAGTIENGTFNANMSDSERGLIGDGQSYIMNSAWDNAFGGVDIRQAGQGYAASLVRAKLVGTDSHTKLDDKYAGVDAMTKYTTESSILSCFPKNLRGAIGAKALSGVSAATKGWAGVNAGAIDDDTVSNDGAADRLWLFSFGEMQDVVYPQTEFGNWGYQPKRSSKSWWWSRSPYDASNVHGITVYGYLYTIFDCGYDSAVAPGFALQIPHSAG